MEEAPPVCAKTLLGRNSSNKLYLRPYSHVRRSVSHSDAKNGPKDAQIVRRGM